MLKTFKYFYLDPSTNKINISYKEDRKQKYLTCIKEKNEHNQNSTGKSLNFNREHFQLFTEKVLYFQ